MKLLKSFYATVIGQDVYHSILYKEAFDITEALQKAEVSLKDLQTINIEVLRIVKIEEAQELNGLND